MHVLLGVGPAANPGCAGEIMPWYHLNAVPRRAGGGGISGRQWIDK